jgi:excisionase family DNA binding protein
MAIEAKRVVSISDAAELCKVTAETIRRWVDHGDIPSTRTVGGHRRIEWRGFQVFLRKRSLSKLKALDASVTTSRTLIIGDNETFTERLASGIHDIHLQTDIAFAHTPFDAGYRIAAEEPDYIFLPAGFPGMDVGDAIQTIRQNARTRLVRIIIVSNAVNAGMSPGVDFSIADPADQTTLKAIYGHLES